MAITEATLVKIFQMVAGGVGATVSLAIIVPKTKCETFVRAFIGMMTAFAATDPVLELSGLADKTTNKIFIAYMVGFAAWTMLGAIIRTLEMLPWLPEVLLPNILKLDMHRKQPDEKKKQQPKNQPRNQIRSHRGKPPSHS